MPAHKLRRQILHVREFFPMKLPHRLSRITSASTDEGIRSRFVLNRVGILLHEEPHVNNNLFFFVIDILFCASRHLTTSVCVLSEFADCYYTACRVRMWGTHTHIPRIRRTKKNMANNSSCDWEVDKKRGGNSRGQEDGMRKRDTSLTQRDVRIRKKMSISHWIN